MSGRLVFVAVCALLGACNHLPLRDTTAGAPQQTATACVKLDSAAEVQLGLVRQMLEQDRAYAGLAHLAALEPAVRNSAQAVHLHAELLRHTDSGPEAERRYRELLGGCRAGYGHHGIGLLKAAHDLAGATAELREAARLLPTDARIRNDFGYALLLSQDAAAARREFLTAVELGDYKQRAALNLALLTLWEGDAAGAERLRRSLRVTDAGWEHLRRRAQQMKAERTTSSATED